MSSRAQANRRSTPKGAKAQGSHAAHLRPFGIPEGIYIQRTHKNRKRAYIVNQYTFRATKQRALSCGHKFIDDEPYCTKVLTYNSIDLRLYLKSTRL